MSTRTKRNDRRLQKLNRRVEREVIIFPEKHDKSLQRLIKKTTPRRKTFKEQIAEWEEFNRRTA